MNAHRKGARHGYDLQHRTTLHRPHSARRAPRRPAQPVLRVVRRQHLHHRGGDGSPVRHPGQHCAVGDPRDHRGQRGGGLLHRAALRSGAPPGGAADDPEPRPVRLLRRHPPARPGADDLPGVLRHRSGPRWAGDVASAAHLPRGRLRAVRPHVHRARDLRLPPHPPLLARRGRAQWSRLHRPFHQDAHRTGHRRRAVRHHLRGRAVHPRHLTGRVLAAHLRPLHRRLLPLPAAGHPQVRHHRLDLPRQRGRRLGRDDPGCARGSPGRCRLPRQPGRLPGRPRRGLLGGRAARSHLRQADRQHAQLVRRLHVGGHDRHQPDPPVPHRAAPPRHLHRPDLHSRPGHRPRRERQLPRLLHRLPALPALLHDSLVGDQPRGLLPGPQGAVRRRRTLRPRRHLRPLQQGRHARLHRRRADPDPLHEQHLLRRAHRRLDGRGGDLLDPRPRRRRRPLLRLLGPGARRGRDAPRPRRVLADHR